LYIKPTGPITAKIAIVGEAPGAEEERLNQPFVGPSGNLLNQILREVGLNRQELYITNVAKERPPGNNIDYFFQDKKRTLPKPFLQEWIQELKKELETVRPNIVIALGDIAYWAICGEHGILSARGYITESTLVPGLKVLPTVHPSHVLRNWDTRFHAILDFKKAVRNSESPEIERDKRIFVTSISLGDFIKYCDYLEKEHSGPVAVDIETTRQGYIDTVGIAESSNKAVTMTVINSDGTPRFSPEGELHFWRALEELFTIKPVIMQNGKFDMASLWAKNRVLIKNFYFDTLIAGHVIWPEAPRSLEFLTSICTDFPRWKNTAKSSPLLYNAQDCTNTYAIYEALKPVIEADDNFRETFIHEMVQNEIAVMLEVQGIYADKVKQQQIIQETKLKIKQLEAELKQRFGKEVNVKSPKQLSQLIYVELGMPVQYKRRKSRNEPKKATTDASAMKKLARETGNKDLDTILKLKKLYKLLTFLDIKLSPESRVHTCYNITGATMSRLKASDKFVAEDTDAYKSFGRWSSSKSIIFPFGSGNLQNIPKEARKIYTAEGAVKCQDTQ